MTAIRRATFNREPLAPSPFAKLPIGSVAPRGWLRSQLVRMADGLVGRLPERSRFCDRATSAWTDPDGRGEHPWEEAPYWLRGFGDLGRLIDRPEIISEFGAWVEGVIATRTADGYFGPRGNIEEKPGGGFGPIAEEDLDLWPNMVMLDVLRSHHDATGDQRVIDLITSYARWLLSLDRPTILPGYWDRMRGGDMLDSVLWLYNITGEPFLLDVAARIHECTADWMTSVPNWHGVNIAQGFREPAVWGQVSGEAEHAAAVERIYREFKGTYGHVPGGMFGADENARPGRTDPRQGAETCSMVEFVRSCVDLCRITGDPAWADRCEEVAFNDLPPSHTADLKSLHYLTSPNQPVLDRLSKAPGIQNAGDMFSYDPRRYRCCQHNAGLGWPTFAQSLVAAVPDGRGPDPAGLAFMLYAPCEVDAEARRGLRIALSVRTNYPFDDRIEISVRAITPAAGAPPPRFPLLLRIPGWCKAAGIRVNGKAWPAPAHPGSFTAVERTWSVGDELELRLPMRVEIVRWPRNHDAASVRRGPLWYSLKVDEQERTYWSEGDWRATEVVPGSPWNYAFDADADDDDEALAARIDVARAPGRGDDLPVQPFSADAAPIELRAPVRRIDGWQLEPNNLVQELQDSPVRPDGPPESRPLIPMGCARLRITAFPVASETADRTWEPPAAETGHEAGVIPARLDAASHADLGEQVTEGALGTAISWEPVTGTTEWATFRFDEPQRVTGVEVYWLDDAGQGNARVPESWSLETEAMDGTWRPVRNASTFGTEKDATNRTTFSPVLTHAVRVTATLRPGRSAGILRFVALGGGY